MRLTLSNFATDDTTVNLWMSEFSPVVITPDTITILGAEPALPLTEDGVIYEGTTYSDVAFLLPS